MPKNKAKNTPQQIQALRAGNKEAFRAVFMEYQPHLYRYLWLRVRSVEMAEDLVQETFVRLWQTRKKLDPGHNLEVYLFRIARNLAINTMRTIKRRQTFRFNDELNPLSSISTDDTVEYTQLAQLIDDVILSLPEKSRTAFLLSRYEELSHKEVAAVMGVSVKTVEKHIGKVLEVLKKQLAKFEFIAQT
ncbi:RNA polymerase sigma-70 factor [candidate division KSB1 bacterium]|nr:RNA polymerase sigma-70 factor [candidate division KSB1 bacterium]